MPKIPNAVHAANVAGSSPAYPLRRRFLPPENSPALPAIIRGYERAVESGNTVIQDALLDAYIYATETLGAAQ